MTSPRCYLKSCEIWLYVVPFNPHIISFVYPCQYTSPPRRDIYMEADMPAIEKDPRLLLHTTIKVCPSLTLAWDAGPVAESPQ